MNTPRLSSLGKHLRYGAHLRPDRDWFVLLTAFAILLVGSLVWNVFLFSKVTTGHAIGTSTSTPQTADLKLDSVTALFEQRAAERARYSSDYSFIDPSR